MANVPEATQSGSKSSVVYHWVILFMYDVEVEFPFSYTHVNDLDGSEFPFPFHLIDGPLDDQSRMIPFELFTDKKYCVFGKIQEGRHEKKNLKEKINFILRKFNLIYWQEIIIVVVFPNA